MKTKTDIRKIKAFLVTLGMIAIVSSGWILFVFSKIERQEEIAREINLQTEELRKQINQRDTAFAAEYNEIKTVLGEK